MAAGTERGEYRLAAMESPTSAPQCQPIWLVANASSGSNSDEALDALIGGCTHFGLNVVHTLRFPEDAAPTPRQLDEAGIALLAIFAGDGTVNAVIHALAGWGGQVLVLPGGTKNLLAKRLHGDVPAEEIIARQAAGAAKAVRPPIIRTASGEALAELMAGPGTAWRDVREALRETDLAAIASGAVSAIGESTNGAMLVCTDPPLGRVDGYPLLVVEPADDGLHITAYYAESAGDVVQQGIALLRQDFRNGPHEEIGVADSVTLSDPQGGPVRYLLDGEAVEGSASETFSIAPCAVDLLATRDDI